MKRRIAGLLAGAFLAGALVVGGVSAAVANGLHGLHGPTQVPAAAVRGATSSGDGMGLVTCERRTAAGVSAPNGTRPVSIS